MRRSLLALAAVALFALGDIGTVSAQGRGFGRGGIGLPGLGGGGNINPGGNIKPGSGNWIPGFAPNGLLFPQNTQWGMQITQVFDGGAKKANLRSGDIILSVGNTRVQSLEGLQAALAGAKDVEISYLNNATRKVETTPVKVVENKIGVEVVPVAIR